jgi:hypothetical protein
MIFKKLNKTENYVYLIFLVIVLAAIAYLKGIHTSIFLIAFLVTFATSAHVFMDIYISICDRTNRLSLLWTLSFIICSPIFYYYFGTYSFLKALSLSLVIVIAVTLFESIKK